MEKEGYMRAFGVRKGKKEMIYLYYSLKDKSKKISMVP